MCVFLCLEIIAKTCVVCDFSIFLTTFLRVSSIQVRSQKSTPRDREMHKYENHLVHWQVDDMLMVAFIICDTSDRQNTGAAAKVGGNTSARFPVFMLARHLAKQQYNCPVETLEL